MVAFPSDRLHEVLYLGDMRPAERERLIHLMVRLAGLPPPPDRFGCFPRYSELMDGFLAAVDTGVAEDIEERFLELYTHLHMHEAPYTPEERRRIDRSGGYWCHAGGLSPILKAGDWIRTGSVSADLGAGNGVQGMLLQLLYPHRRSVLIEISQRMADIGQDLQDWLQIPPARVTWMIDDLLDVPIPAVDFLYLYRPVHPDGPGKRFYERLADELDRSQDPPIVFSIADCLAGFLSSRFDVFYSDGHLTCIRSVPQRSERTSSGPRR